MDDIIIPARFAFRIINFLAFMMFGVFVLYTVSLVLVRFAEFFARKLGKVIDDRLQPQRPPRPPRPTQPPSQPPDWR